MGDASVVIGSGKVRIQFDRLGFVIDCILVITSPEVDEGSVVVDFGLIGLEPHGLGEISDSLVILFEFVIGETAVVIGVAEIRFFCNRLTIIVNGFFIPAFVIIGIPPLEIREASAASPAPAQRITPKLTRTTITRILFMMDLTNGMV